MAGATDFGAYSTARKDRTRTRLHLALAVKDLALDWRRHNLVCNYVAEFCASDFDRKDRAENLISSVLYECLTHVQQVCPQEAVIDVEFATSKQLLAFQLDTTTDVERLSDLSELIDRIHAADQKQLDQMYLDRLAAGADDPTPNGFGLLMIAHDYGARLGLRLDPRAGTVTVRVLVDQTQVTA